VGRDALSISIQTILAVMANLQRSILTLRLSDSENSKRRNPNNWLQRAAYSRSMWVASKRGEGHITTAFSRTGDLAEHLGQDFPLLLGLVAAGWLTVALNFALGKTRFNSP